MNLYDLTLVGLFVAGLIGAASFTIAYQVMTRGAWRRSMAGRYMMVKHTLVVALMCLILYNRFDPEWAARQGVTLVLFGAYVFTTWGPLWMLWVLWRENAPSERDRDDART